MKTDARHTERGRALELLGQRRRRAIPLFFVGRRAVDHVGGVHDDMLRSDAGLRQLGPESRQTLGLHPDLVVVKLRDRTEDLQRLHAGLAGAPRGHGDAAGVDAVGAKKQCHG
jgi:hypothetical protein